MGDYSDDENFSKNDGFEGILFPGNGQKDKVVIVMSGSNGGMSMARDEALFYHRHGFPALALALFRTRQTQKDLSCVPVEYVENSIYLDHPTEAGA